MEYTSREKDPLMPHLFRTEFPKITAFLCRYFGVEHLEEAEDTASESFLAALESWPYKGIPENPSAWLYRVAKNKALNRLAKMGREDKGKSLLKKQAVNSGIEVENREPALEQFQLQDDELRMLFVVCHPALAAEAQIALALRVCCGFGIDEIAAALLAGKEAINKRLYRAREKIRTEKIEWELPASADIAARMQNVLLTIYLLFTEGYYSETNNELLREELCREAMRLAHSLTLQQQTNLPEVQALIALFCFHASRFPARKSAGDHWLLYHEQDAALWNQELIAKGAQYLHRATVGRHVSRYHLEAAIAYWHTRQEDSLEKWASILGLYDQLLEYFPSQVAALNRAYAVFKVKGADAALETLQPLELKNSPYYYMLLAELYKGKDLRYAKNSLQKALALAKTEADKRFINTRILLFGK
ncbi:DUF6596 domain-containing protein [Flavihumibacter sp. CACIAM 22H1]|uniref:RNA polymerase sigma factor n=1 Tax=Flavihumibacter sp. CACIAM 22H1 TaxID=1812911 RepID=UPI0007A7EA4C|nr:DUF6596 domain-containing protein [Flavihumibacter sp. CACIAM 22H1]KYP16371.1 MAG: RNA polymerase subunit sigma [Flavihumibacter sp. CACIAM 22H1]